MPGTCPRCTKTVYFNEEKIAMGKSFHKSCFSCANKSCNRKLDSGNLTTHDNELYCKVCYARLFGPKGYNLSGFVTTDTAKNSNDSTNGSPSKQTVISPKLESKIASKQDVNSKIENNGRSANNTNISGNTSKRHSLTFDDRGNRIDICPRCNKKVYLAEKMMAGGKAWHKMTCFNCLECHKRLESTTLCEKDEEIYCKTCYAKKWGPSGYGHGIDAGSRKVE